MKIRTKRIATAAVLTALGVVLGFVESLLPPFTGIPGVKPGLANIVVLIAMNISGPADAFLVSVTRILLSGLSYSGMFAMLYSLAGGLLSLLVMLLLKKINRFSVIGISIAGGVAHNIGQLAVACAVTGPAVVYYMPVLIVSGLIAGMLTGFIASVAYSRLRHIL